MIWTWRKCARGKDMECEKFWRTRVVLTKHSCSHFQQRQYQDNISPLDTLHIWAFILRCIHMCITKTHWDTSPIDDQNILLFLQDCILYRRMWLRNKKKFVYEFLTTVLPIELLTQQPVCTNESLSADLSQVSP